MSSLDAFESIELDMLKEVGNIGAGNAATALSKLLDKPVIMAVPKVSLLPFDEVTGLVGGSEKIVLAVYLRVEGDAPGNLFFIIDEASARRMLEHLISKDDNHKADNFDLDLSALGEIVNIIAGSYLSALADFTQLSMVPSVPAMAHDMAGAILSFGLMHYGGMGDSALLIEAAFLEDHLSLLGHFFLIPDPESFNIMCKALGVDQR